MESILKKVCDVLPVTSTLTPDLSTFPHTPCLFLQEQRGLAVSVTEWKDAVEHAQCLATTAERKSSAQRGHLLRRLLTIEMESERLRVSVMEAEKKVQRSDAATKKVNAWVFLVRDR